MKILHVVPTYFPAVRYGGPIYSVHGLAAGQAALGHEVSVFTTNVDGPGVSDVRIGVPVAMDGVAVTYFPVGSPRRLYRSPAMRRALATHAREFDVLHLHSVFLWPTLAAARAAKRARIPFVLSPRGMLVADLIGARSSAIKTAWLRLFERRTIREASAIHFTAVREEQDFLALGLVAERSILLPNGVEEPVAEAAPLSSEVQAIIAKPGYALSLGRLNWKKNLVALIDALAFAPDARLVIAGTDDENHSTALRSAIATAGLQSRVTLIDRNVVGADKDALFAHAAIFVLPSLNENFGNTVLEAMIRGTPVVVSNGAGVAEVVREADCGLIVGPTPEALGEAIAKLLADPVSATTMGQLGQKNARDLFGWQSIAARMIAAYERLSSSS